MSKTKKLDYRCAAIAIGHVALARDAVEKAAEMVESNCKTGYPEDFVKVYHTLNKIVYDLNRELDKEDAQEDEEC